MKKELGPEAKLHDGPYNKAVGGINSTGPAAISKISKNIPPKSEIKQEYILPEIEISTEVEEQRDPGKTTFIFSKERASNMPNPKATQTTASNIQKIISNEPSSREMEVRREEQDWSSGLNDPTQPKDYKKFMKSTGRFPDIYGSKEEK